MYCLVIPHTPSVIPGHTLPNHKIPAILPGMSKEDWTNKLYYGDNLHILRDLIPDESVDLIYLDPPFGRNTSALDFHLPSA